MVFLGCQPGETHKDWERHPMLFGLRTVFKRARQQVMGFWKSHDLFSETREPMTRRWKPMTCYRAFCFHWYWKILINSTRPSLSTDPYQTQRGPDRRRDTQRDQKRPRETQRDRSRVSLVTWLALWHLKFGQSPLWLEFFSGIITLHLHLHLHYITLHYAQTHRHADTHAHMRTHTHIHTYTHRHTHTHIHTYIHTYIYIYIYKCKYKYIYTYTHTHIYIYMTSA